MSKSKVKGSKRISKYVVLNKKRGETPLNLLQSWKSEHAELENVVMSYAGRLDPMAEGKMLVLLGDECKKQDVYTKLDKEYEIQVLLGISTDTGDVLGIPAAQSETKANVPPNSNEIRKALKQELGPHSRKYPIFSSKTVNGKLLFLYALENTLDTITIPEHIEKVYKIKHIGTYELTKSEVETKIEDLLSVVPRSDEPSKLLGADFRQDEIRAKWRELFSKVPAQTFTILKLRVTCGSGTYMRTLAERIGGSLGTTALALSINRTRMGKYLQFGPVDFWAKEF
jgi:tRNA pseudouridine55 synthase